MTWTCLVIGGSRAIGARMVADGIDRGWDMWHMSRGAPEAPGGRWLRADLGRAGSVTRVIEEVADVRGRLDAIILNAVVMYPELLSDLSVEAVETAMRVNLQGVAEASLAASRVFGRLGMGRLVLMGSVAAMGSYGNAIYGASKAAMERVPAAFETTCQVSCRCWCLRIGAVDEGLLAREPVGEALSLLLPRGRALSAGEVSEVALTFASGVLDVVRSGVVPVADGMGDFPVLGRLAKRLAVREASR